MKIRKEYNESSVLKQRLCELNRQFNIWAILRDVAIVWVLTAMGGFVSGFATNDPSQLMLARAASNLLLGTVAFTISGCLAPAGRWRHLGFVALGAWFTSLINVVFLGVSIPQWIYGAIVMAIIMGIGGSLSFLFKRKHQEETPSHSGDDEFYDEVARELQEKPLVAGLWTRAFAEMGGDDAKARALYIKYRVASLKEEERNSRIKLQGLQEEERKKEKERKKEEASDRDTMKSRMMTICKKCGYAGRMNQPLSLPDGHAFLATACKCPKCSHRFDWYYVPSKDFPEASKD